MNTEAVAGRCVAITGGARGIGLAIATALHGLGGTDRGFTSDVQPEKREAYARRTGTS
jgi:NAD(P)-dependent dehydrogenase (short-subunit alcohol dehydrogenase family)